MDLAVFRTSFPEFASETAFPDPMITFWSGLAEKQVARARWADQYTYGVQLATAHYVSLAADDAKVASAGGTPGGSSGVVASEGAGPASVSYDTGAFTEENGGHWNQTKYGRMYLRLARIAGMGGVQL